MTFTPDHTLYPYQQEALDIMVQRNTLLAFDMGTGKTPTTLAAIEDLRTVQSSRSTPSSSRPTP